MKKIGFLILILVLGTCLVGCKTTDGYEDSRTFMAFGTFVEVTLWFDEDNATNRSAAENAFAEMKTVIDKLEVCLSADDVNGDAARFNAADAGEKVRIEPLTAECFKTAQTVFNATDGAYNPAVYNLVDLWGFSARRWEGTTDVVYPYDRDDGSLPQQKYIDAFILLADFENIVFSEDGGEFYLKKPETTVTVDGQVYTVKIDFGGICKGFATDKLKAIAEKYGVDEGNIVSGMSSVTYLGNDADNAVDLVNPVDGSVLLTKNNVGKSISVSGDYQRFFTYEGRNYCHIIDASTGYPTETGARTVFAECDSAAVCDGVTTALMTFDATKIALFADSEAAKTLGVRSVISVFEKGAKLSVYTNSPDVKIKSSNAVKYSFTVDGGEVSFTGQSGYGWLWGVAAAIAIIAVVVALAVKNGKKKDDISSKSADFKTLKFFKPFDVVLYVAVVVVVAGVFVGVGVAFKSEEWSRTEVWCEGVMACYFDNETRRLVVLSNDWAERLAVDEKDGVTTLTVYFDDEKTEFNKILFEEGKVTMLDSSCRGRDCVKAANTVTRANQIVICMPHALKVAGVGNSGNKEVR